MRLRKSLDTGELTLVRQLQLGSECISGQSYSIFRVSTDLALEVVSTAFVRRTEFTVKDLDTPVSGILPDQVVTLKVTLSFE